MSGARKGFTLIELIIAVSLSGAVLIGIMSVTAQMVRFELEGARKNEVAGWMLLSLSQMNRELENATTLLCPSPWAGCAGNSSNVLSGCVNYTRKTAAALDPDTQKTTVAFYYCRAESGQYENMLLRYAQESAPGTAVTARTCPISPTPVCGNAPGAGQTMKVVATNMYGWDGQDPPAGSLMLFQRMEDIAGMEVRYSIGFSTATSEIHHSAGTTAGAGPNPTYMRFRTKIAMNKVFFNGPGTLAACANCD